MVHVLGSMQIMAHSNVVFDREISSESISNIIVDFADTDGQIVSFYI